MLCYQTTVVHAFTYIANDQRLDLSRNAQEIHGLLLLRGSRLSPHRNGRDRCLAGACIRVRLDGHRGSLTGKVTGSLALLCQNDLLHGRRTRRSERKMKCRSIERLPQSTAVTKRVSERDRQQTECGFDDSFREYSKW